MKLILTRHGETIENIKGIIQGHLPGKLTKKGIEQAKKLALRLKNEKIDFIYSSDLARASDTTKEIIKFYPNIPIKYTKALRERNWGEFQGKTKKEMPWAKEGDIKNYIEPEKGEKPKQILKRADDFIKAVLKKHKKETILIVAHGGINNAIITSLYNKPEQEIYNIQTMNNTAITIFNIDKKPIESIFNCTSHLK